MRGRQRPHTLLEGLQMNFNTLREMPSRRLAEILSAFPRLRVAVLGDFFLDKYYEVDPALAEPSLETGKMAHQVVFARSSPGAAGTVAANMAALRAGAIHAIGPVGDDGEGYELRRGLERLGCSTESLVVAPERMTPTYLKPRDKDSSGLEGEHSRYDSLTREAMPGAIVERLIAEFDARLPELDAVAVCDQVEAAETGAITSAMRAALAERARRHPKIVFWADSRFRIRLFRHVIIKPNQFEAVGWANPAPGAEVEQSRLAEAAACLRQATGAPVCVTRGAAGLFVTDPEPAFVPGVRVDGPVDPTGAGDSVTAGAVLALAAGARLDEAALVGALTASVTVASSPPPARPLRNR